VCLCRNFLYVVLLFHSPFTLPICRCILVFWEYGVKRKWAFRWPWPLVCDVNDVTSGPHTAGQAHSNKYGDPGFNLNSELISWIPSPMLVSTNAHLFPFSFSWQSTLILVTSPTPRLVGGHGIFSRHLVKPKTSTIVDRSLVSILGAFCCRCQHSQANLNHVLNLWFPY
jgi:hypothetical protein